MARSRAPHPTLRHVDTAGLAREDAWAPGDRMQPLPDAAARSRACAVRAQSPSSGDPSPASLDRAARGETPGRGRHRRTVRGARAGLRGRLPRRRRSCAPGATATRSPTSSTATSTTPTSAPTAASSAPSPRAGTSSATATSPTISSSTRSPQRTREAWAARRHRGVPAGRHPARATPATPISTIVDAVKSAAPDMHVHAFSPLEVWHGADDARAAARRLSGHG